MKVTEAKLRAILRGMWPTAAFIDVYAFGGLPGRKPFLATWTIDNLASHLAEKLEDLHETD